MKSHLSVGYAVDMSSKVKGAGARRGVVAALLAFSCLTSGGAALAGGALPSGGQFVAGAGAITATANGLSISQSGSHGIINWQSFSIGQGQSVNIANGLGATLNRVTGGNISNIAGSLTSTGSVYLVNPAGVIVLPSGQVVTTGSFVASTRDVSNSSFLAGGALDFTGTSSGAVVNQGSITSSNGDVVLIGQSVTNTGQISAPNGTAALAAGDDVLLQAGGDPTVLINAGTGDVTNSGSIAAAQAELAAAGGNVYALATNNGGAIRATGTTTKNGHVYLTSTDGDVTVDSAVSATNADGSGGAIVATGGSATGSVTVNGSLNASATGKTAKGGSVTVTASSVAIASTAAVSANGGANGGTVLIGGDRHGGSDPSQDFSATPIANAQTTRVAAGAQISANGGTGGGSGNGGNVVVWSDQSTSFAGSIAARGGAAGGNGGFVEVSGKQTLAFTGLVDTSAPLGLTGTLLLDPANVTISTSATSGDSITGGTYSPSSGVATSNINNGDLDNQLANNNVLVTTTNSGASGGGTGNITVSAPVAWNSTHSLTLNAAGVISFTNNTDSIINAGTGGITLIAGGAGLPLTANGTPGLTAGVPVGAAITVGFDPQTIGETFTPVLSSGGAITITATNGDISVSGPISASGSGAITLTAAGIISFGSAADPLTATGSGGISLTASGADVTNLGSAAIAIGANITAAGGAISIVSTTAVPAGNGDGNGSGSGFGGNIISSSEVGYGTAAIGYQITMGNAYSITNTQANGAGTITLQADQVRLGTGISPGATVTTTGQVNILPTSPGNTGSSSAVYLGDTDTGGAFYNPDNVTLIPGEQVQNVTANLIVIGNSSTTAMSLVNPSGEAAPRFEAGNASNLKLVTGASGSVTQDANSPIIVDDGYGSLSNQTPVNGGANGIGTGGLAVSTGGAITLNNPYNSVGTIAFSSTGGGAIAFTREGDNVNGNPGSNLVVGTVGGVSGVNTTGTFILTANETNSSTSSGVAVGALTVTQDDTSAANAVKVGSLLLEGPISSFTLDNLSNQIATVAASVQTMTLVDNTALATGSLTDPNTATTYNGISAAGAVTIVANASFTIASGDPIATTSGNVMIEDGSSGGAGTAAGGAVAANTGFVNNDGTAAFAVTGGGTWRVYSQDPRDDSKGGLTATQYNFVQYAAPNTYGAPSAATTFSNATADINASASGNGFIYTVAPTVAATISTTLTRVYDGDTDYPGTGATPISYTKGAVTVGGNTVTNLGTGGTADTVTISNTTITLPLASGFYPSKNVGTYTVTIPTTSPTTPTYTTKDANNVTIYGYVLNPSHSATASITPAPLTVSGSRYYNGGTSTAPATLAVSGTTYGGDSFTVSGAGSVASANASVTPQNIATSSGVVTGLSLVGTDSSNYQIVSGTLTINPEPLTITASTQSRSYGSTAGLVLGSGETTQYSTSGLVNNETIGSVTLTGSVAATTATTNAGTLTNAITPSGAMGGTFNTSNYNISYVQGNVIINPALLTVTGTKVYDTTTGFGTSSLTATGGVNGQTVTLNAGTGTSSGADVNTYTGPNTSFSGLGITVTGGTGTDLASNYQLPTTGSLSITPAALTVTASTQSRSYGSTAGLVLGTGETIDYTTSGLLGGQTIGSVTLTGNTAATSASTNAGTLTNAITPSAAAGGTFNASDYNVSYVQGNVIINPALLTVTGTKVYDSTTGFTTNQLSVAGGANGETVALTAGTGTSSGPDVNTYNGSTLSGLGISVTGGNALASNYQVPTTGTLSITPAALTVTASPQSRSYGSTTGLVLGTGETVDYTTSGLIGGQTIGSVTLAGTAAATSASTNAGTLTNAITPSAAAGGTFNAADYNIGYVQGNVIINPALLTVTGTKVYDATTGFTTNQLTATGGVNGETVSLTAGTGTSSGPNVNTYAGSALSGVAASVTGGNALASNYQVPTTGTLSITPAPLTVTGTKVYDTTTGFTTSQLSVTGGVGGQTVALTGGTGTSSAPDVNTYAGSTLTGLTASVTGGSISNYQLPTTGALTITPAALTVTASPQSRTYGSTTGLVLGSGETVDYTTSGLVGGQTIGSVTLTGTAAATSATTNAGTLVNAITPSAATGGTFTPADYAITYAQGNVIINPALLTVTGTKVYDTTTGFTTTQLAVTGGVNGQTVALTGGTGTSSSPNAATYPGSPLSNLADSVTGGTGTPLASNYQLPTTGTLTITPAPVTVSGSRYYDGLTDASGSVLTVSGFPNLTATGTGAVSSPNASTTAQNLLTSGGLVTGLSLSGTGAGNYSIVSGTLLINPEPLTIGAVTQTKLYDGTTVSTNTPVLVSGALLGGTTLTNLTQAYQSRNVLGLNGSILLVTSYTLSDSGNYTVTLQTAPGTINPEPVTVTAVPTSKPYDGTPTSPGTPAVTAGTIFGPDTGTFTQTYNTPNAGTGLTLTPTGFISDGNGGNNYIVTYVPITSGIITPQALTISAVTQTKVYDGTTVSTGIPVITAGALVGGDTLTNLAQAYQSRNVLGTNGSTLFVTSYTLSDPGNYNVTVKTTPGTITPEPLIVTAVPTSKTYDGTSTSSGTPLLTSGTIFGPDTGKFIQAYNSPNAGQTVTLTPTGVLSDGNGGNNYTVTYVPISTGVINPLPVILHGTRPFDDNTDAASSILAITNLIGGDVANISSGTGTLVAGAVGLEQIANFGTLTLGGPSAGNYTFVGGSGDVLVTSAVATIAVPPLDQTSSGLGSTTYSFTAYSGGIVRLAPRQNGIVTGTIATVEGQNAGPDTELGCTIGGTGCIENGVGVNPTAPAQAN